MIANEYIACPVCRHKIRRDAFICQWCGWFRGDLDD